MSSNAPSYRHVVLFRFKKGCAPQTIAAIEQGFVTLAQGLPFVSGFEWGRNSSPEGLDKGFTHCFIVTFSRAEDRDAYLPHPDHQAFCRTYLDPNLEDVCVVDFLPQ